MPEAGPQGASWDMVKPPDLVLHVMDNQEEQHDLIPILKGGCVDSSLQGQELKQEWL